MESTNVSDEVLNLMPGAVALFRADESIFCANEAMQDLYDCQSQREFFELTGASFRGMVLPEHYESIAMMVEKAMQHGSALQGGPAGQLLVSFLLHLHEDGPVPFGRGFDTPCLPPRRMALVALARRCLRALSRGGARCPDESHGQAPLFFPRCRSARTLTALKASTAGTRWRTSI